MIMFQRVIDFFYRRRRGFVYSAGVMALLYYSLSYLKTKLLDYRSKANQSRIAKENLKKRFEQNQEDCLFSIATFLPHLSRQVLETYDVEAVKVQLNQMKKGSISPLVNSTGSLPTEDGANANGVTDANATDESTKTLTPSKSKVELWNEIKDLSFTRNLVALHLLALLSIFIHIQINMVGRLIYIESVIGEASENSDQFNTSTPSSVSYDTQKQYLCFSWWIVNRGWKNLGAKIHETIEKELKTLNIRERLTYQQLSEIISQLRHKLEVEIFDQKHVILDALLPNSFEGEREVVSQLEGHSLGEDYQLNPNLRKLLDETKDFIECQDFDSIRLKLTDKLFSMFDNEIRKNIFSTQPVNAETETMEMALPLPKILPILSNLLQPILEQENNNYLREVSKVKSLQAFSAIIYSSFQYYED